MRVRYERSREPQLPFQETEFTHLRPGGDFGDQPCANRAMRPRRPTILGLTQLAQFEFGFGDFASGGVSQIKWLDG